MVFALQNVKDMLILSQGNNHISIWVDRAKLLPRKRAAATAQPDFSPLLMGSLHFEIKAASHITHSPQSHTQTH